MKVNGSWMAWEGGSFRPNGARVGRGSGGAKLAKNLTRWSSKEPILAARIFVGFNVGHDAVYKIDDLIQIVRPIRQEQTGDPSSTFVAQRGIYRHDAGDVIEEDGAQVIILNTAGLSYDEFVAEMVHVAEQVAIRMKQEEVIIEIQRGGVTQEVLGVGPAVMAANGYHPGAAILSGPDADVRVFVTGPKKYDQGEPYVEVIYLEDEMQGERGWVPDRLLEYRPNADWEASGRIAYRGRASGGPSVDTELATRAEPEPTRIDYKLTANQRRRRRPVR